MNTKADARFGMIDVGEKPTTSRRALAKGSILVGPEAFSLIQEKRLPKGDVLALAEAAGIMAAKRTSEQLPLCHPLSLDSVSVSFSLDSEKYAVGAACEARARAKTGVEMEALAGVSGALLCVYDLVKGVNPALCISEIHLECKEGGKSGCWHHPEFAKSLVEEVGKAQLQGITAAVITVSDRVSRGESQDKSGPLLIELLEESGADVCLSLVVEDELESIASAIREAILNSGAGLLLTTGGTGLGPRDVTPEAVAVVCQKMVPGIGELLRMRGLCHTPFSVLSRSAAGVYEKSLVVALPGSPNAVRQGFEELVGVLAHALKMIRGEGH